MQNEWFVVMTLQAPMAHGGFVSHTKTMVLSVGPDATREAVYDHMRAKFPPEFASANVVCFSAEPNQIGGGR
ncbi:hypothetical protein AB0C74_39670 [Spirillospora sp. NPDC048832]